MRRHGGQEMLLYCLMEQFLCQCCDGLRLSPSWFGPARPEGTEWHRICWNVCAVVVWVLASLGSTMWRSSWTA